MAQIRSIKFPLTLEGSNLATDTDANVVRNAIMHVLSIQPSEYLMRPAYGTPNRLFETVRDGQDIVRDIESRVRDQVGADYPTLSIRCFGEFVEGGVLDFTLEWELDGIPQPAIALKFG